MARITNNLLSFFRNADNIFTSDNCHIDTPTKQPMSLHEINSPHVNNVQSAFMSFCEVNLSTLMSFYSEKTKQSCVHLFAPKPLPVTSNSIYPYL